MSFGGSFQDPAGNFVKDSDGFSPPNFGGPIAVKAAIIDFEDITTPKVLFTLPAGAVPLDWWFDVGTDFNAGTNNNLDIGIGGDPNYFADDVGIGTQGIFRAGVSGTVFGRLGVGFDEPTDINALYAPSGTAVTTGSGIFFMTYMMQDNDFAAV